VVLLFAAGMWVGLYLLFNDAYRFHGATALVEFRPMIVQVVFAAFFLSLLILLAFSNGIIAYGSLFRSEETAYLFTSPFSSWQVFAYKLCESLLFSSWAFLFLALPLIVAVGVNERAPWYYYPGAALFFATFAAIPAAAGGSITLLIARFLPRSPRRALTILAVVVAALILACFHFYHFDTRYTSGNWVQQGLGRLSLTQSPLLPSYWAGQGILDLARGRAPDAVFRLLLLLSTALFLAMISVHLARGFYTTAYHRTQDLPRRRRGTTSAGFYRLIDRLLPGMSSELRALLIKDLKTFVRDPVQWSQVLIFFGLLGIYFANIRTLQYRLTEPFWKHFISLLNFIATCLTLSTFTSRFIFPLLSLEGRKFWILGLLPIERRNIFYSKFWFALIGSLVLSEGLMALSDLNLGIERTAMALHAIALLVICSGLSALAVGIGALYPNLRESNPSKIVSGFGGTLNLVLSVSLVALVAALLVAPYHLLRMQQGNLAFLRFLLLPGEMAALVIGAVAVVVPLWLGVRAFERFEA